MTSTSVVASDGCVAGTLPHAAGTAWRRIGWLLVITLCWVSGTASADTSAWTDVVERVSRSVVSLKVGRLRSFDGDSRGNSTATGFVVDAERGIILTNRHVIGAGPVRIAATFRDEERVDAMPLYRDPVHDFAFLRYDPAELGRSNPPALALHPEKVALGLDVRVIGSDGGEQLSILSGTIAHVARRAPRYGRYGYNDFNTFYIQAASSTSGGSSGSPVIDRTGDVVALNAAANPRTASSFFLPLWRVRAALEHLQAERAVPRGGLQTVFAHEPRRELIRLGVAPSLIDAAPTDRSNPQAPPGRLVVEEVLPAGVAAGVLREGDVLLSLDGRPVDDFVSLEASLDARIGRRLDIEYVRNAKRQSGRVEVADLNTLIPTRLLELGDSALQEMSLHQARAMHRPQVGVVIEQAGYHFDRAGMSDGALILSIDQRPIRRLEDVVEAIARVPAGEMLTVRYLMPGAEFSARLARVELDDRWFRHRLCQRRDGARRWQCDPVVLERPSSEAPPPSMPVPASYDDPLLDRLAPNMVRVSFDVPFAIDNVYARHFEGVGLIVDAAEGLVVIDRNTVPVSLGDAEIVLLSDRVVDAEVVFLHPRHNVAVLAFDPARLGELRLDDPELVTADELPPPGDLSLIAYRDDGTIRRDPLEHASVTTLGFPQPSVPRFQQSPVDVLDFDDSRAPLGGLVIDEQGRVQALHTSFAFEREREMTERQYALPARVLAEAVRQYRSGRPYRSLDAVLGYGSLADARRAGLPDDWLDRYRRRPPGERRVLHVARAIPADPAIDTDGTDRLQAGDVLLALEDRLVTDLFEAEQRAQVERLGATVLRDGAILTLTLATGAESGLGTDRVVGWAGALFQAPHAAIAYHESRRYPGVYVAWTADGSAAEWDGLYRNRFVTAIDGQPIETLDDLIERLQDAPTAQPVRLSLIATSGRRDLVAVQPEYHFWPTFELLRTEAGWQRRDLGANEPNAERTTESRP